MVEPSASNSGAALLVSQRSVTLAEIIGGLSCVARHLKKEEKLEEGSSTTSETPNRRDKAHKLSHFGMGLWVKYNKSLTQVEMKHIATLAPSYFMPPFRSVGNSEKVL